MNEYLSSTKCRNDEEEQVGCHNNNDPETAKPRFPLGIEISMSMGIPIDTFRGTKSLHEFESPCACKANRLEPRRSPANVLFEMSRPMNGSHKKFVLGSTRCHFLYSLTLLMRGSQKLFQHRDPSRVLESTLPNFRFAKKVRLPPLDHSVRKRIYKCVEVLRSRTSCDGVPPARRDSLPRFLTLVDEGRFDRGSMN